MEVDVPLQYLTKKRYFVSSCLEHGVLKLYLHGYRYNKKYLPSPTGTLPKLIDKLISIAVNTWYRYRLEQGIY